MVLSYVWRDKIVMMADSRRSTHDNAGNFIHFDDQVKIRPNEKLVIGNSGLTKAIIRNGDTGKILEIKDLLDHFFNINKDRLLAYSGQHIIEGLVDTWNSTLKQSLGLQPNDHPACFMLAKWENGLEPMIYTCETSNRQTGFTSFAAVIGDDQVKPIVAPYFDENLINRMKLEDTIDHFKRAYIEVSDEVKTVGGKVNIFILDRVTSKSKWL